MPSTSPWKDAIRKYSTFKTEITMASIFRLNSIKHLESDHNVDLLTQTMVVSFKCRICGRAQLTRSSNAGKSKTFWHQNSKSWSQTLHSHLSQDHPEIRTNIDLKNEWESFYHKAVIAFASE